MKRPQRCASGLAGPLQTSMDWLLWEKGPKQVGPQYFSRKKLVENYEELPSEVKEAISQAILDARKTRRKRNSA